MNFNLEYYKAFYYAARLHSFSQAANVLFLTQPAISQSIHRLENELGVKLFTRTSRGMLLTPEGNLLYGHVQKAFSILESGEVRLRGSTDPEHGEIRIGATETALTHFILPRLSIFRESYPKVSLQIRGCYSQDLLKMLADGNVDIAFGVSPVQEDEHLSITEIQEFQDVFIAGPSFSELEKKVLTVSDLTSLPLVMTSHEGSMSKNLMGWLNRYEVVLRPHYTVLTTSYALPFLENNLAVAFVPEFFYELWKKYIPGLFRLQLEEEPPMRSVFLATNETIPFSAACRELIRLLFPAIYEKHPFR